MTDAKTYPYQGSQGSIRLCPVCPGAKLKSVVTRAGVETRTANAPGFDSWAVTGAYIPPAMTNTVTATFTCNQSHKWTEQGPCY